MSAQRCFLRAKLSSGVQSSRVAESEVVNDARPMGHYDKGLPGHKGRKREVGQLHGHGSAPQLPAALQEQGGQLLRRVTKDAFEGLPPRLVDAGPAPAQMVSIAHCLIAGPASGFRAFWRRAYDDGRSCDDYQQSAGASSNNRRVERVALTSLDCGCKMD